jgi:2-methylfumaryl-CoA isomerase
LCEATGLTQAMHQLGHRLGVDLGQEGQRFIARGEISALVAEWLQMHTSAQIAILFDQHAVCWSRYQSIDELVKTDPSCSVQNPLFSEVDQPGVGKVLSPGLAFEFSALTRVLAAAAPRLGEHTEQVLSELLGVDAAQFGRLHDKGIVI